MTTDENTREHQIYPGNYQPAEGREIPAEPSGWTARKVRYPAINVTDSPDLVKVELLLPGFRREDFFVCCKCRVLQVFAMHHPANAMEGLPGQFERHIPLPAEVAVEFIAAEYNDGVLRLHLPKAKEPSPVKENHEIVIY